MKHIRNVSKSPLPATVGLGLTPLQQMVLFLTKGKILI